MQNILIIGATSAIAEATARVYAGRGSNLFLAARDAVRLHDIAEDLRIRGANEVAYAILDVNDENARETVIQAAWEKLGRVDVTLIAHGTLPQQDQCERDTRLALAEFATNGTSTIALMTQIAQKLEAQGQGAMAVISSVAGDRGRQSNYLYGSAKAAVTTYLSGLRQRLSKHGIGVTTIKPGFVDTPMTQAFKKGALWAKPDDVAHGIVKAVDRKAGTVYLPGFWRPIMFAITHVPEFLFNRLKL